MKNPSPLAVRLSCTRCQKEFTKFAADLASVCLVTDNFSHCDSCEEKINMMAAMHGEPECSRCTKQRKGPYAGENKPIKIPLFDWDRATYRLIITDRFWHYEKRDTKKGAA